MRVCYTCSMSYWKEKLIINDVSYPRFLGGPLDGYTDSPWRRLVRQFSPDNLLYTEMRHVSCVAHERGAQKALNFEQGERPLNFQITINTLTVDYIEQVVAAIEARGVDAIDVNIACPARNVVGSQSGSALMSDIIFLERMLVRLKAATSLPVTVKMRAGFKKKNAVDVVRVVEQCGISAVAVHPRLQSARFSGEPDYELVAEVKKSVAIPVLYSGGIHTFDDACMVYERTGVDGFLIGRGMFGCPWKLALLKACSEGKDFSLSQEQQLDVAIRHLDLSLQYYGDDGLYAFRKHLASYIGGFAHAARIREQLMRIEDPQILKKELRDSIGIKRA
jgi:tRNA-dihydrouridine synthase B